METILITGANRGLGLEFVRQYAQAGCRVFACCRDPQTADGLQAVAAASEAVRVCALDVSEADQITALAKELDGESIDILLNNAGLMGPRGMGPGNVDKAEWIHVFVVNTVAPLQMVGAFLPHLLRGERKLIATMTSKMGSIEDNSSGGSYVYRSTKSAVNQVNKSLSIDLAGMGVTSVVLHPGWVSTDMGGSNATLGPEESVRGLRGVLDGLTPAQSGAFVDYGGAEIPW